MGQRASVLAGLAVLAASACSAVPGTTSAGALAGIDDLSAVGATAASGSALIRPGSCLGGERLADSPTQLARAVSVFGLTAYSQMADDPIWSDVVACSSPHRLEVYAAVTLPPELDDQVAAYTDLLDPAADVAAQVGDSVAQQCAAAAGPASAATSVSDLDVDVLPLVNPALGRFSWSAPPPESWETGDHTFGCLFEQQAAGTTLVSDLSSGSLPLTDRICLRGNAFVPCDKPHDEERIAMVSVDRAVAAHELLGARALGTSGEIELGADRWTALDGVCERYLRVIAAAPASGLRGVADTYPELYPDESGHYSVYCTAQSRFGTAPRDMVVTTSSVYDH